MVDGKVSAKHRLEPRDSDAAGAGAANELYERSWYPGLGRLLVAWLLADSDAAGEARLSRLGSSVGAGALIGARTGCSERGWYGA